MSYERIRKEKSSTGPVMADYDALHGEFQWDDARKRLDGLPGGGLNIAFECVDRHAQTGRADHTALRWIGAGDERQEYIYGQLAELSDRFGASLQVLEVLKSVLPPELRVAVEDGVGSVFARNIRVMEKREGGVEIRTYQEDIHGKTPRPPSPGLRSVVLRAPKPEPASYRCRPNLKHIKSPNTKL